MISSIQISTAVNGDVSGDERLKIIENDGDYFIN